MNTINFEENDKNKKFFMKVKNFYNLEKEEDIKSKIYSDLFRYYIFQKVEIKDILLKMKKRRKQVLKKKRKQVLKKTSKQLKGKYKKRKENKQLKKRKNKYQKKKQVLKKKGSKTK